MVSRGTEEADEYTALAQVFARHAERRAQGIPTVTVLAGAPEDTWRVWRDWYARDGRAVVTTDVLDELESTGAALAREWLAAFTRRIEGDILNVLAHTLAREIVDAAALWAGESPAQRLRASSERELERWLDTMAAHGARAPLLWLCRYVYMSTIDAERAVQRILADATAADESAVVRLVAEICALVPDLAAAHHVADARPVIPGIALRVASEHGWHRVYQANRWALDVAARASSVPVAVMACADAVRDFMEYAPESRVKASVRASLIWWPPADANVTVVVPSVPEPVPIQYGFSAEHSRTYLRDVLRATPELAASFERAVDAYRVAHEHRAESPESPESPELEDRARSHAERVLFAALQRLPETRDVFQLNPRLDIPFGRASMEVDLLCPSLRVVVEVDGYYHFRDMHAYRHDRRKDLLLQLRDHLVVRCLADDVITALDAVLDTILDAIRAQRARITSE